MKELLVFRKERDWEPFHTPKDLAISISLEASELLEIFQWKDSETVVEKNLTEIKEELADIMIYSLYLSHDLGIDIQEAIRGKIEKNKQELVMQIIGKPFDEQTLFRVGAAYQAQTDHYKKRPNI
ncbi:nucleotide pyrophosphohydrolase [Ammoniphilus sp. 3BR4]|uniref:nucleotide pyrophosphohydrolase n=1 Tax=Ammoniphilus sp. 3BR4 TaxID=3158265 RepID=UPI0034676F29